MICFRYDDSTNQALSEMLFTLSQYEDLLRDRIARQELSPFASRKMFFMDDGRRVILDRITHTVALASNVIFDPVLNDYVLMQGLTGAESQQSFGKNRKK